MATRICYCAVCGDQGGVVIRVTLSTAHYREHGCHECAPSRVLCQHSWRADAQQRQWVHEVETVPGPIRASPIRPQSCRAHAAPYQLRSPHVSPYPSHQEYQPTDASPLGTPCRDGAWTSPDSHVAQRPINSSPEPDGDQHQEHATDEDILEMGHAFSHLTFTWPPQYDEAEFEAVLPSDEQACGMGATMKLFEMKDRFSWSNPEMDAVLEFVKEAAPWLGFLPNDMKQARDQMFNTAKLHELYKTVKACHAQLTHDPCCTCTPGTSTLHMYTRDMHSAHVPQGHARCTCTPGTCTLHMYPRDMLAAHVPQGHARCTCTPGTCTLHMYPRDSHTAHVH